MYRQVRPLSGTQRNLCRVHTFSTDGDEPFCFYLIALEGVYMTEPLWFEDDEREVGAYQLFDGDEDTRHGISHSIFIIGGITYPE